MLESVAISSSRGSYRARDQTSVACIGRQIILNPLCRFSFSSYPKGLSQTLARGKSGLNKKADVGLLLWPSG